MNEADEALSDLYSKDAVEAYKADIQGAYEEKVLKKIMLTLGLEHEIKAMCNRVKQITGKPKLTFSYFYSQYPNFPVWLSIQKLPYVHTVGVVDLFNKFASNKIISTWSSASDEAPEDVPVGLVFDYTGVHGVQLICHDWDVDMDVSETRICRRIGTGRGYIVWIERLESFMKRVQHTWAPN